MNVKSAVTTIALLAALPGAAVACPTCDKHNAKPATTISKSNIVETAAAAGSFETLVAAVKAAGLVEALQGDGPFTVFAPTDEAFANLPAGTVEELLKPENRGALTAILTYHVVPGRVTAKDVVKLNAAGTLNGQRIDISAGNDGVRIDNANVVKADIACSNGVIHVIDSVIMPSTSNIVETADTAGSFGTLLAAAKAAGLAELLASEGPFTVFAPTDEAFAALPAGTVESLLQPQNREKLAAILKYHVVPGRVYGDQAAKLTRATTAQGGEIRIKSKKDTLMINDASVIAADIEASNGVIHVIDTVLLPE